MVVLACLALSFGFFVSGCGKAKVRTVPVRGKVTLKGKPVPNGTILFEPRSMVPAATGEIQKDGTYALKTRIDGKDVDGAVPGDYVVSITALEDQEGKLPEARSPLPAFIIPEKYGRSATSGLKAMVEDKPDNEINFPLK
jgi:hypothetical protein